MTLSYGVHSEIGKLRRVLVHRPGAALSRLTPSNCHDLLFDDVIWVKQARAEHKASPKQGCAMVGVKPARKLQDHAKPDHDGKEQCRGGFRRKNNGQTGQRRRNIRLRRRSCQSKYRQC